MDMLMGALHVSLPAFGPMALRRKVDMPITVQSIWDVRASPSAICRCFAACMQTAAASKSVVR